MNMRKKIKISVTPFKMLLDVNVLPKKKKIQQVDRIPLYKVLFVNIGLF